MARTKTSEAGRAVKLLAALATIAALYLARDILIPVALAVLLTFVLHPLVERLSRLGLHRVLAVILTVAAAAAITASVSFIVLQQAADLTGQLPDYRENLKTKIRALRTAGSDTVARISGTLQELKQEFTTTQPAALAGTDQEVDPVRVEVVSSAPQITQVASMIAGPLLVPLAAAGITGLLLIFLLVYSHDVRERLIWIAGMRQVSLSSAAMDEVSQRIGRYLRMQFVVNLSYGVLVALGLQLLGIPNALLWGAIGGLLRYVPYIGPWIAAALPTLLAVAVFPDWSRPLGVVGMFALIELFTNMVLEPWLYGSSAGISTLGVVFAAVFWAWVWGPVGLILAVPISVCLVVLGKYVPQLSLFHQLFGNEDAVPDVARLYQRLLVNDEEAAEQMLTARLEKESLAQVCDQLLVPVLRQLKRDYANGLISVEHARQATKMLELLCRREVPPAVADAPPRLLCAAGRTVIDEAAARLLAHAAQVESVPAEAMSSHALAREIADRAAELDVAAVCVVQVAPAAASTRTRHILKTLATRLGKQRRIIELALGESASHIGNSAADDDMPSVQRQRCFVDVIEHIGELRMPAPKLDAAAAEA